MMVQSSIVIGMLFVSAAWTRAAADVKPGCAGVLSADDPLYDLIDECKVRQCDTGLQTDGSSGSHDEVGLPFTRCLVLPEDDDNDFPAPRFSGCINDENTLNPSRCFYKNPFYAQCVPQHRVLDKTKPRFAADGGRLIEVFCGEASGDAEAPDNDVCLLFGDSCEEGVDECCEDLGLGCYRANVTIEETFCLECPGDFAQTYERCVGGDVTGTDAEGQCCFDDSDECVLRDASFGSCRPKDESCCERITFALGDRSFPCPRSRDEGFVPGPCDTSSQEYEDERQLILDFLANNS